MSIFSEQLKQYRVNAGLSVKSAVTEFEKYNIFISEKTLYGWERGIRTPDADVFLSICKVYGIDSISAFLGEQKSAPQVSEFDRKFEALDSHGKKIVSMLLNEEFDRVHPIVQLFPHETQQESSKIIRFADLLVSEQSAAAGTGTPLDQDSFTTMSVPESYIISGTSFGIPVSGDSMEPRYFDGDILLINKSQLPEIGEIGVFMLDGKGYVKQRGKKELISLNAKYAPIPMDSSTRCFGKVIGAIPKSALVQ